MIKSLTITNHLGESITLELMRPEQSGFIVKPITGLGPPKANVNTTETATHDGSVYNSARLTQRNIVLNLEFYETTITHQNGTVTSLSIEDIRQNSYKYFPIKKNITVLVETDNRIAETIGYVEANEPTIFSKNEGCNISIVCPDPFFYSKEVTDTIFYGVEPAFEFPFENDSLTEPLLETGIIHNRTEEVVTYKGDSEIGVTITIHAVGDASNITIYNVSTRETMKINTSLIGGDTIVINTKKGDKSATLLRDGATTNIFNALDRGSKWFTLAKGDNVFAYRAEIGGENLQFRIAHKTIYDGV